MLESWKSSGSGVFGVGGVGLHALQMARLAGGLVIAIDVNAEVEVAFEVLRQERSLWRNVLAI